MPPWTGISASYCDGLAAYTSDEVFCEPQIVHFWRISLGLALLFWGLLLVANLLPLFHSRAHDQSVAGEALRRLLWQMGLLVLAACSFYLLEVANQVVFYVVDALTTMQAPRNCVDCLWTQNGPISKMIADVHALVASQNQGNTDIFSALSGGQYTFAPTDSPSAGLFGQSWGQLVGGIATFAASFTTLGPAVRYVVIVLALGSAPFALMAASHPFTRPLFQFWLHLWGELVVLSLFSALVLAGWHAVSGGIVGNNDFTSACVGLAALGLLGGMNLAYLMRIMGSFLQTTSGFYQANYQRLSSSILTTMKLGAAVVGGVAGVAAAAAGGAEATGGAEAAGGKAPTNGTIPPGAGGLAARAAGGAPPGGGGLSSARAGPAGAAALLGTTPSGAGLALAGAADTAGAALSPLAQDGWREWSASGTARSASPLGAGAAPAGLAPGSAAGGALLAGRGLQAAPTGRSRGIAIALASTRFPVLSETAGPLAAGLSYAHQMEQEGLRLQHAQNQEALALQRLGENERYHSEQLKLGQANLEEKRQATFQRGVETIRHNARMEEIDETRAAAYGTWVNNQGAYQAKRAEREAQQVAAYGTWVTNQGTHLTRRAENEAQRVAAYGTWVSNLGTYQAKQTENESRRVEAYSTWVSNQSAYQTTQAENEAQKTAAYSTWVANQGAYQAKRAEREGSGNPPPTGKPGKR